MSGLDAAAGAVHRTRISHCGRRSPRGGCRTVARLYGPVYSASSAAAVTLSRNPPRRTCWITSSERRSRCSQSSPGRGSNHRQRPIRCACRLRHRPEQARGSIHRFAGPSADHLPDLSLSALAAASSVFSFPLLKRSPRGQLLPSGPAGTAVAGPGSLP